MLTVYELFAALHEETAVSWQDMLHLLDILTKGTIRTLEVTADTLGGHTLESLLRARQAGQPWEYILGYTTFMGLTFHCTPAALIPRAETELLVKTVLAHVESLGDTAVTIIDMGTGSGNIAVSLARHAPNAHLYASDISREAVDLAQQHVTMHQLNGRVHLFCGDLFMPLPDHLHTQTDIIVCNPPYLPTKTIANLPPEIKEHEPHVALDAGPYGLNIFRRLVKDALDFLKPGGLLAFEIGAGQAQMASRLLQKAGGYTHIRHHKDHIGDVRVLTAQKITE
jgi:release factor glutamine methyltransferase